ncbi:MAG: hypothetical protein ACFB00_00710 [Parvularculaceae bacterium]
MTPDEKKTRRNRNLAVAFGLVAFIALIYVVTYLRISGAAA